MYACNCETGRGFFAGVFTPSNATAHSCDPPPPSSKRRLVLHYSKCSGQVFARNTITVAIEVIRVAGVLLQDLLCLFMCREARAVKVAICAASRARWLIVWLVFGKLLTRYTVAVSVEVVRIAQVLLVHPLSLFMGFEAGAVEVAICPTPRTGRLRRRWRFSLRA
jgi:hypothetical protein